jgi:hypothetical protein
VCIKIAFLMKGKLSDHSFVMKDKRDGSGCRCSVGLYWLEGGQEPAHYRDLAWRDDCSRCVDGIDSLFYLNLN